VGNKEKSHSVNLREVLSRILPPDCTVSFERATKSDPSAVMLSSFLLKNELTDAEAVGYLQSLKRAQSKEYNNVASTEYLLHPFKNIYWDFSPQGIANINYSEGYSGQDDFLVKYHNHVGKEYLLMTLLLLHQEYTLIDYCQCLSQLDADDTIDKRMETMYGFKMKYVTSTISHLENYRKFFNLFRNTLNIDDLLAEVEMKLQSMYAHISQARMEEQLAIEKENAQRQEEMNALRKKYMDEENERKERISATVSALSVVLALFGVVSVISDGIQAVNTLGVGKSLLATAIILLAVAIVIVATFILFPIVAKKLKAHIDNFDFTKEE